MNIESIQEELQRLLKITHGWQDCGEVSPIERDIAADGVKRLYELIALDSTEPTAKPTQEPAPEPEVEVELTYYEGEDEDIEVEQEVEDEQEEEVEDDDDSTFELGDISIISDGNEANGDGMLFDMNEIPVRQKSRRSAILSLYSDTPPTAESNEPSKPEEPKESPKIEVVEEIMSEPETITQRYATEIMNSTLSDSSVVSASINDRYIIVQELFAGDMSAYEHLIEVLGRMSNFDDCMIHIAENYDWDADCDAAKLFVSTLKQRFDK